MKTAVIYVEEGISYYVLDGGFQHLNGTYVGSITSLEELQDEVVALLWNEEATPVTMEEFRKALVEGACLIEVGQLL